MVAREPSHDALSPERESAGAKRRQSPGLCFGQEHRDHLQEGAGVLLQAAWSLLRFHRFAVLLRSKARGAPSVAHPLAGTTVHRTLVQPSGSPCARDISASLHVNSSIRSAGGRVAGYVAWAASASGSRLALLKKSSGTIFTQPLPGLRPSGRRFAAFAFAPGERRRVSPRGARVRRRGERQSRARPRHGRRGPVMPAKQDSGALRAPNKIGSSLG